MDRGSPVCHISPNCYVSCEAIAPTRALAHVGGGPVRFLRSRGGDGALRNKLRESLKPMIECDVTGLLAWRGGQPGQVGNEAATAVFHQCRGSGSSPSAFVFSFSRLVSSLSLSRFFPLSFLLRCSAYACRIRHRDRISRYRPFAQYSHRRIRGLFVACSCVARRSAIALTPRRC